MHLTQAHIHPVFHIPFRDSVGDMVSLGECLGNEGVSFLTWPHTEAFDCQIVMHQLPRVMMVAVAAFRDMSVINHGFEIKVTSMHGGPASAPDLPSF